LLIDFKTVYHSFSRKFSYTIQFEFGIFMKLLRLIKMCLNETCSRFQVRKNLSDVFSFRYGLKQGYVLSPCFSTLR
jgi:hypothetical protein